MTCLIVDLVAWNELEVEEEPFKAFLSILEQAPAESPGNKLRHTGLAIRQIKKLTMVSKYNVSKLDLESKITKRINEFTKSGSDLKALRSLLALKDLKVRPGAMELVKKIIREQEKQQPKTFPVKELRRKCLCRDLADCSITAGLATGRKHPGFGAWPVGVCARDELQMPRMQYLSLVTGVMPLF